MAPAVSVEPQPGVKTMRKIVELKIEETKAVVGGSRLAAATVVVGANPVVTTSISAQKR
jgi:hypothetical protein